MLYWILRITVTPIAKLLFRTKIINKYNIIQPPAILAANHEDNSDAVCLSMLTWKKIIFVANQDTLEPPTRSRFITKYVKKVIVPKEKGKSQEVIDQAERFLKNNNYIAIFPEGTLKGKNKILEGKTGVARMALQSKVPVIPIAIINTYGMWPKTDLLPKKLHKVTINIGRPMYFKEYYGRQNDRKVTRLITDKIMNEIKKLHKEY